MATCAWSSCIAEKPRHGYEIINSIEDQVAGVYSPSPGVIYPTLSLLEELGQVTVSLPSGTAIMAAAIKRSDEPTIA